MVLSVPPMFADVELRAEPLMAGLGLPGSVLLPPAAALTEPAQRTVGSEQGVSLIIHGIILHEIPIIPFKTVFNTLLDRRLFLEQSGSNSTAFSPIALLSIH